MKNLIIRFVEKTWITLTGACLFCIMFWIPVVMGGIMAGHGYGTFESCAFWLAIVVLSIWAVYYFLAWRIALPEIFQRYLDSHKDDEGYYINNYDYSGNYGRIAKDLNEDIDCAAISFFGCLVFIVVIVLCALFG